MENYFSKIVQKPNDIRPRWVEPSLFIPKLPYIILISWPLEERPHVRFLFFEPLIEGLGIHTQLENTSLWQNSFFRR